MRALPLMLMLVVGAHGSDNGVARLPPMGWSNWNFWANHINASIFRETAQVHN